MESVHYGSVVIVDSSGRRIASAGNPAYSTYIRSAAKPLQAIPLVETGAAEYFGLTLEELALVMASHSGEERHVRVGERFMEKIGLTAAKLQCGTHPPLHRASARELAARGEMPTVLHCTCSGKHAGMLALARYLDLPLEGYYLPEHPVQVMMLRAVAEFAGLKQEEIGLGVDGCGVPVFALPLDKMALAYARWAEPSVFAENRQRACGILRKAAVSYPYILAGTGRLASELMEVTGEKLAVKDGNEGIFCIACPEKGWGIAVKISDGSLRALGPAVIETLRQLGLLTSKEYQLLAPFAKTELKNYRREVIGEIRPVFSLQ